MDLVLAGTGFAIGLILLWCGWPFTRLPGLAARPKTFVLSRHGARALICELDRARNEILAPARSFSHPGIAAALLSAIRRGATVHLLLEGALEIGWIPLEIPSSWQDMRLLFDPSNVAPSDRVLFIVDRKVLVAGLFPFVLPRGQASSERLVIAKGYADLVDACARRFLDYPNQCREIGTPPEQNAASSAQRPAA